MRAHDELRPDCAQRGGNRALVGGVEIGVQQAPRDRVDLRRQLRQLPVEGLDHVTVRVEPTGNLVAQ